MKKILSLILVILFIIPLVSACGAQSKPPAITYTTEILINQETPPDELKWYVQLDGPTDGGGFIPIPSYISYATLDTVEIVQTTVRDYQDILETKAPFHGILFENQKRDYILKVLGMTGGEFDRKIGKHVDLNAFRYYTDCVIGVIRPLILQPPVEDDSEYAGKNIFVYYDYENSVVIPYTDEELMTENDGVFVSCYTGRVDD